MKFTIDKNILLEALNNVVKALSQKINEIKNKLN